MRPLLGLTPLALALAAPLAAQTQATLVAVEAERSVPAAP